MEKKILLGSIFAVVILIFLSFTNVVGYQNDKTSFTEKSPLFSVRTNKAIEQENNLGSSDYIGKGKDTGLSFPTRNKNPISINEIISWIANLDKKSFMNFKTLLISRLNNENKLSDSQMQKILNTLSQIRKKPRLMMNFFGNNNYYNDENSNAGTVLLDCTFQVPVFCFWSIFYMIALILYFFFSVFFITCYPNYTCGWTCSGPSWCLIGCGPE
ncbi:MAG: hypothetical protein ACW98X_27125 [Promethearchaeota archaeon]|jgi:hypothetical protein